MKKITLVFLLMGVFVFGQNKKKITGMVTDENDFPVYGVNVSVVETYQVTTTDGNGFFSIEIETFPVTLIFNHLDYSSTEVVVEYADDIKVVLTKSAGLLDKYVVSASRVKEKIKESPVSVEYINAEDIRQTPSMNFFEDLEDLKTLSVSRNSLSFQSINARGFATFENDRFLLLIDGMDNSPISLNFPLGNMIGINELDIESVEILPGASSALYGANAFNGVMNIRSKNPFRHAGLSIYTKYGFTQQTAAGTNPLYDVGFRYAAKSEKMAFKMNFSYLLGTDWYAQDYTDVDHSPYNTDKGTRELNPSYDGLNIYGDEIAYLIPLSDMTSGAVDDIYVSRTGYEEKYLTDYKAKSMKGDVGFYLRPKGAKSNLEIIWNSRFGSGKTIYQGSNRYVFDNFLVHQHKLEVHNDNFFIRAHYKAEDAGDSYDSRFTGWNINRKWRSDKDWFTDYAYVYVQSLMAGADKQTAHATARDFADNSDVDVAGNPKTPRFQPGSDDFNKAFKEVISDPDFTKGARFVDKSNFMHFEGNYKFNHLIKHVNIQVGASYHRYNLLSDGTIYTDFETLNPIYIDETAAYIQVSKKFFDKHLKISNSIRYDKQKLFEGNFSPRISLVYSVGDYHKHNFRLSMQTGFRNPSTQDLYIGLNAGPVSLVGAAPDNPERYKEYISAEDPVTHNTYEVLLTGTDAYNNSYTLASFQKFHALLKQGIPYMQAKEALEIADINPLEPEKVKSFELGYRGLMANKLNVDISGYYNIFNNFKITERVVAMSSEVGDVHDNTADQAIAGQALKLMQVYSTFKRELNSYGLDVGLTYKAGKYKIGLGYDYALIDYDTEPNTEFQTHFNTPKHQFKLSLANKNLLKNLGFHLAYKYQTEFLWEGPFATGLIPERHVLDAQMNYFFKKQKILFKIGGSNLLGEYMPAPGTGMIGKIYYISLRYGK